MSHVLTGQQRERPAIHRDVLSGRQKHAHEKEHRDRSNVGGLQLRGNENGLSEIRKNSTVIYWVLAVSTCGDNKLFWVLNGAFLSSTSA